MVKSMHNFVLFPAQLLVLSYYILRDKISFLRLKNGPLPMALQPGAQSQLEQQHHRCLRQESLK